MTSEELAAVTFDPLDESPVTRGFVESLVGETSGFQSRIHRADEMHSYNLAQLRGHEGAAALLYYQKGWQVLQTIRRVAAWRFGGIRSVPSFLDFAGGYGRVTRFLVRELEPERITVSEIHADAVDFQRAYFGVRGLVSTPDPAAFAGDRRFAFVMATSFFSHVPGASFQAWLAKLLGCVGPGGVLAFSTLDLALLATGEASGSGGMVFLPESETTRIDSSIYGTAYVTEAYVREAVHQAGGKWAVSRFSHGLCGLQDLHVVVRGNEPSAEDLEAAYYPWGDADVYEVHGDRLSAGGLVYTAEMAPPLERVELFCGNRRVEVCHLESSGPRCHRWSFETDFSRIGPDEVMSVRAVAGDGLENFIGLASPRTHPPSRRLR